RERASIEAGEWNEEKPPKTLGQAFDRYRAWARVKCGGFASIDSCLKQWERLLGRDTLLAQLTTGMIEKAIEQRVSEVSKVTVDTNIRFLKRVFSFLESRKI